MLNRGLLLLSTSCVVFDVLSQVSQEQVVEDGAAGGQAHTRDEVKTFSQKLEVCSPFLK
jgi:hypothetical protein